MGSGEDLARLTKCPRRLPKHISRMTPIDIGVTYGPMAGNAEATAAVPAAICTATVTT